MFARSKVGTEFKEMDWNRCNVILWIPISKKVLPGYTHIDIYSPVHLRPFAVIYMQGGNPDNKLFEKGERLLEGRLYGLRMNLVVGHPWNKE